MSKIEPNSHAALLDRVVEVARSAGELVMAMYDCKSVSVQRKSDSSPVTEADAASEDYILLALGKLTPRIPVVSEEAASKGCIPSIADQFWLVDPLDGTKEFLNRNGEFTVNIALVENGEPVLGVVYAPAFDRLFAGRRGGGAFVEEGRTEGKRRSAIFCRKPESTIDVVASRSHSDRAALEAFLVGKQVRSFKFVGSSLKLCIIAIGEADVYPRLGNTMEWDIAAAHAVLAAAGGFVRTLDQSELRYGKRGFLNPHFVASGRA